MTDLSYVNGGEIFGQQGGAISGHVRHGGRPLAKRAFIWRRSERAAGSRRWVMGLSAERRFGVAGWPSFTPPLLICVGARRIA